LYEFFLLLLLLLFFLSLTFFFFFFQFFSDIENADGFAQVFPEHKYKVVETLQGRGHLIAMTGDGVNDAPALKKADVGIAVEGASEVARAAASMVLLAPGLGVVIDAIKTSRQIFKRMYGKGTLSSSLFF